MALSAGVRLDLGANIGAAVGTPRLQASDEGIEAMADDPLAKAGGRVGARLPQGPAAKPGNIHDGGGRYISLLGSRPFLHNISDRWPVAVDLAAVSRSSEAFALLAVRLTNS